MMPTNSTHGISPWKRHEQYYLHDGNACFLIENTLFRLHRFFFERESDYFRDRLGPSSEGENGSPQNPYILRDVSCDDFADFIWLWYNPKYSFSKQEKCKWLTILRLAKQWRFSEIRKLAVRQLEKINIDPIEKIATYKKYSVDETLLLPSYVLLCMRQKLASPEEGEVLTMGTVLKLAAAREQAIISATERGHKTPTAESLPDDIVYAVVADLFGLTLHSNDPTVQMEGQTGNTSDDRPVDKDVITVKEPTANKKGKVKGAQESPQPLPAPTTNGVGNKGKQQRSS